MNYTVYIGQAILALVITVLISAPVGAGSNPRFLGHERRIRWRRELCVQLYVRSLYT